MGMAEIEFFANEHEILDLMKLFLESKCVIIPDLHYVSKSMKCLTDESEIKALSEDVSLFFVVKEDIIESPLQFREVTTPEKHFYYISPHVGGPSMQFYWGKEHEQSSKRQIGASWLSYYPWYEDSITRERKKPSNVLISIYSEFAKAIRKDRRKVKPSVRAFWISPYIEQLIRQGALLIGLENFSVEEILN
jgi:hypothetical protein